MTHSEKTNGMFAQASWLLEQSDVVDSRSAQLACRNGFILLFEQTLIAFVLELEDSKVTQMSLMPWLLELETDNWLVRSIRKHISEPGHWLNDWYNLRKSVDQAHSNRGKNTQIEDLIYTTNGNSDCDTYREWLKYFIDLMNEYRELNSQY
jgi:hypothetical protein